MIYSDYISEYVGEDVAWAAPAIGETYNPPFNGSLIGLRMFWGQGAATSVIATLLARLSCPSFGGRPCVVALAGGGLQTAPAFPTPVGVLNCDLPVESQKQITVEFRHSAGAITPVTSNAILIGIFEG